MRGGTRCWVKVWLLELFVSYLLCYLKETGGLDAKMLAAYQLEIIKWV